MGAARLILLPWLILAATLGVTWLVWDHEHNTAHKELHSQFDFALREAVSQVEQRMTAYEQMLRGVQGLLAATGKMDRNAFHDYIDALQLDANFSGVQAIGIALWVPAARQEAHSATMRRLGFTDYAILPAVQRDNYAPIIQREPQIGRNRIKPGFDPWSDPVRRRAMEQARDSGMPAISGKIHLTVDTGIDAPPGFVMYLPIFAQGQPHDSVAQRRTHLLGWVFASFRMHDLMASLYGEQPLGLAVTIYDGVEPSAAAQLYPSADSGNPQPVNVSALTANEYLVVASHTWMLSMRTLAEFEARYGRNAATLIAWAGASLSLLLALLAWLLVTGRTRAQQLAATMTVELRRMAQHDALTELPNRALFSDRLQHELTRAKRHVEHFALIFLDLDKFKPINDTYGHRVGDQLLQQVARRLQDTVRASDTVGRIGGDEFVVLMPALSAPDDALRLAEKICQALRHPFAIDARELTISCSAGVAVYPDHGSDEITLAKSADEAMYRAKEAGRDGVQMGNAV